SNADQINAIGAGLGQAALVCARGDPTFANEIHQMVAVVNNQPLTVTFAAVVGNAPATPSVRDVRSGGDVGGAPSSKGIVGVPANPLSLGATAPTGASVGATATTGATNVPTNTATTATQGVTGALGTPTEATAAGGTAATGATNAQAITTGAIGSTGVTGTPNGAATNSAAPSGVTGTIATSPTGAAA